jgi:prevent-host-death family protein
MKLKIAGFEFAKINVANDTNIRYNVLYSKNSLLEVAMIHIPVSEFKNEIAETLNRVVYAGERVLLQRHGKDVAALVSMREVELLEEIEQLEDQIDLSEALKALKELRSGKDVTVSWDDVKKDFGL